MAIFHLTAKTGSAAKGQSGLAKSNYIKREGKYLNRKNDDVVLLKEDLFMPDWAETGADFWRAADQNERANARIFKELEFALPRELTFDQQTELVADFIHSTFEHDHPMSIAIHAGKGTNPHCHLMFSERINDGLTRSPKSFFKRANRKEPRKGGALKADCSKKWWLQKTRENWARCVNISLEKNHFLERVSHLSLEAQGVDRVPQIHYGVKTHHALLNHRTTDRVERLKQRNALIKRVELNELYLSHLEGEKRELESQLQSEMAKKQSSSEDFYAGLRALRAFSQVDKKPVQSFPKVPSFPALPKTGFGIITMKTLMRCVFEASETRVFPEISWHSAKTNLKSFSLQDVEAHQAPIFKEILEKSRAFFEACPFDGGEIVNTLDRVIEMHGPSPSSPSMGF